MHALSPKVLARAIGVSESSLKRWADEGMVRATRTAGGHRRILQSEAVRFIREIGATVVRPDLLGLSDLEAAGVDLAKSPSDLPAAIHKALEDGDARRACGLVQAMYLSGCTVAAICDGPLRDSMHALGKLWQHAEWGIAVEHRATDICIQAINHLRVLLPPPRSRAPVALGCALGEDPYLLPSLMAATTLAELGFADVNLGPVTPGGVLLNAAAKYKPALVWVSASATSDPDATLKALRAIASQVRELGCGLIVGGRALEPVAPAQLAGISLARSMQELAAFGKGLLATVPVETPAASSRV